MNSKKIENLLQQELIEAVGYLRLSRDDGEEESTSITNQRAIIDDWAKQHGFIITKWYVDDGYSGY
jgi:DNA invertase Pin-like site-specific DNA recombinase